MIEVLPNGHWHPMDGDPALDVAAKELATCAHVDGEPLAQALSLARRVADLFNGDGAWSVDLLPTERGWFITDMAIMERSFHWPDCPYAKK